MNHSQDQVLWSIAPSPPFPLRLNTVHVPRAASAARPFHPNAQGTCQAVQWAFIFTKILVQSRITKHFTKTNMMKINEETKFKKAQQTKKKKKKLKSGLKEE